LELYNQQYSGECTFEEFYKKEMNENIKQIMHRLL